MRRDIGGHTDRDAHRTVDEQVWETRRQDDRFLFFPVIVIFKIYGILLNVLHHLHGDLGHPRFCISHGRRAVSVHRTEVAMSVDQRVAVGKVLRHAHHGVIYRRIAVRMVFTDDLSDDTRGFLMRYGSGDPQGVHGMQDTPVDRLHAVTDIGKRTLDDDRHRVVQERCPHLPGNVYLFQLVIICIHVHLPP